MKLLLLLAVAVMAGCKTVEQRRQEIVQFLKGNGFKYIDIISTSNQSSLVVFNLYSGLSSDMFTRLVLFDEIDIVESENRFRIFMITPETDMAKLSFMLTGVKIRSSLLIFNDDSLGIQAYARLKSQLKVNRRNSLFFVLTAQSEWKTLMAISNNDQVVENSIDFIDGSKQMKEQYDLQGLKVRSTSLTWTPYLILETDKDDGSESESTGFFQDIADAIGQFYNLTFESSRDVTNSWGLNPISGPYNLSGEWGGVMGDVVTGKFHTSLSAWYHIFEREAILDFVPVIFDPTNLVLTPQSAEVDLGLFIRPFTGGSWKAIGVMICIILALMVVPYLTISIFEQTTGYMIAYISAWYFFVLLNAFYGGALTMFFSSEITIDLQNVRDVMRAYPNWKLLMLDGLDVLFQPRAQQGDPDYVTFWDRVINQRAETVVDNLENGLKRLKTEPTVLMVSDSLLKGYFSRENPFHQQELHVFGRERPRAQAIILTKNSPLTPVFLAGVKRLRESGTLKQLEYQWVGKDIRSNIRVSKVTLSTGQTILVYMIIMSAFLAAIVALVLEFGWKRALTYWSR